MPPQVVCPISMKPRRMWQYLHILFFISLTVRCEDSPPRSSPPKNPPVDMVERYTLDGRVPIESFYVDDTNGGMGTNFGYTTKEINQYVDGARKLSSNIHRAIANIQEKNILPTLLLAKLKKEDWLYFALYNYSNLMSNSNCAVFGSTNPWVESLCIASGAASVTTVEYNTLTYGDPIDTFNPIRTVSGAQFNDFYASSENSFDVAFSISSFDHDGLGRYGDPLDPEGDLKAMRKVMNILKPGGLLFMTVPVGPDVVVFNLHRRYGHVRLPLLLDGWEVVDRVGWLESRLEAPANWRQTYEPVFVLRKPQLEQEGEKVLGHGDSEKFTTAQEL
jgi:SAM-dependent methyltransferase